AQGQYEKALEFFQKAIAIWEEVLDAKHPSLATSYNNIGLLYQDQGQYEPALEFYQKAIAICSESLGDQHPNTQTIKNNLERLRREIKNKTKKKKE
ncbi:MAG: tetratricopeptide repeat protein, partial [Bacteroidetes bacterium]|nr:tetratricopeptide repeat protein [Bacteroidota bacterium]